MKTAHDDLILQVANLHGLPFDLLQSQVIQESSGKADALRYEIGYYEKYIQRKPAALGFRFGPLAACSYGLLQILLETALELSFTGNPQDLFMPRVGLHYGALYLAKLWQSVGNTTDGYRHALARYNGTGPQADAYATAIYQRAGKA